MVIKVIQCYSYIAARVVVRRVQLVLGIIVSLDIVYCCLYSCFGSVDVMIKFPCPFFFWKDLNVLYEIWEVRMNQFCEVVGRDHFSQSFRNLRRTAQRI